jgi:Tol biopolymer transport system component/DNA-binding winged helix-turn-helix (wHTH) protein
MAVNTPDTLFRFGVFEVDPRSGELRKSGSRVKLQGQPFKVLVALLERPGEVVTREELKARIWPNDSFGDFDHAVNVAVAKLRSALCDSADMPRYVETLPRRGYRFVASVDGMAARPENQPSTLASSASERRLSRLWIVCALLVAMLAAVVWRPLSEPRAPQVTGIKQITHDGVFKFAPHTDGLRIYFTERTDVRSQLFQVSTAGGETAPIPASFIDAVSHDLSPDKSELLISTAVGAEDDQQFSIVALPAASARRLSFTARDATWSVDGRHLVVCKDSDLYLADHDGTGLHKLISLKQTPVGARFSPDGARIRFTLIDSVQGTYSLWEVKIDGTGLHALFPSWNNPPYECCGKWTSDGRYYVFRSTNATGSNIWALPEWNGPFRRAERQPSQLTAASPLAYTEIVPDRNSNKLFAIGTQPRGELVRYDSHAKLFVPFLGGISAGDVEFSHDGQWVTYVTYPDDLLWRSRVDGSERLQLSNPSQHAGLPHWSIDGKQIAFVAQQAGKPWKIFLVSAQGGRTEELLGEDFNEVDPSWSPDSAHLAFGRLPTSTAPEVQAIFVADLKTRQVSTVPGSEGLFSPRWSPDGRFLAAIPGRDQTKLMLFDFQTQKWSEWTKDVGQVGFISWSKDGEYMYFATFLTDKPFFGRVKLGRNKFEPLVDLKGIHRYFGPWAEWNGIAPDNSPLLVRDISTREIYAIDVQWP